MLAIGLDFAIDAFFAAVQRFHRARAVVNDAEGTGETEIHSASRNDLGVFRIANTAADHRIDVYSEVSQLGKILEFLVQDFQAFFGNIVRLNVINADLKVFESGFIQRDNFLWRQ